MIGYGMAKAAVHQLVRSLAAEDSGLPKNSSVIAILPITLDTPMNRKWMPKADFGKSVPFLSHFKTKNVRWTSMTWIGEKFLYWLTSGATPESGSLLKLVTEDGKTTIEKL